MSQAGAQMRRLPTRCDASEALKAYFVVDCKRQTNTGTEASSIKKAREIAGIMKRDPEAADFVGSIRLDTPNCD